MQSASKKSYQLSNMSSHLRPDGMQQLTECIFY